MQSFRKQILVVDHDPDLLRLLGEQLEGMGYKVQTAMNGLEGFEVLKQSSIDGILLAVLMPDMDGLQMLRRILEKYPHMPVIVMAAAANTVGLEQAIKEGAMKYLLKPIDNGLLSQKCRRVFD